MFKFFRKDKNINYVSVSNDKIWLTKAKKYQDIYNYSKECAALDKVVVIASFFDDSFKEIDFILTNTNLEYEKLSNLSFQSFETSKIYLSSVQSILEAKSNTDLKSKPITFLIAEHYPILAEEEKLFNHLNGYENSSITIQYFETLDSKLMSSFGSERIASLLQKMGLTEDESIEHSMINKSIRKAQEKITKNITIETKALSQKEWFEKNKF